MNVIYIYSISIQLGAVATLFLSGFKFCKNSSNVHNENSRPQKLCDMINVHHVQLLGVGVIGYTAIDNQNIMIQSNSTKPVIWKLLVIIAGHLKTY